ncbi:Glial cell line-derived neurotrophic factor [Triplophysa tibetana]|uniref:Glial cell line-derived neurotrophic factor n=1 Tax=Triplophysa tibetana TaxID=1572043 RepID=A0A5A9N5Q6_9TELE|nr:Glial cell line-derived neurotrophic factor [Triplophysa tibetana]
MKLWDIIATCLLLLTSVSARPLFRKLQPSKRADGETPALDPIIDSRPETADLKQAFMEEQYDANSLYPEQFEDVMDFIQATIGRLRRSPDSDGGSQGKRDRGRQRGATNGERSTRGRGDKKRSRGRGGGRGGKESRDERVKGPGRGCLLKEIHLNVTDLGLGYSTKEELLFRYCSGPCYDSETNYDKILNNLTHNKKLDKDTPSRTCCRPIAFDDDISFLDDSLEYHTLKKHSAKKCACV